MGWEEKAEKVEYTCRGQLSRWLSIKPYWRLHGEVLVEGKDEIGSFEVPPTSELRAGPRRSSSGKGSGGAAKIIWADEDDR